MPEELQPILRDFTKAVLRDRPDDVLQYSRQYFIARWTEERMGEHHTHNYVLLRHTEPPLPCPLTLTQRTRSVCHSKLHAASEHVNRLCRPCGATQESS